MSSSTFDVRLEGTKAPGTINDYELVDARRSLALLKRRLGREDIEEADRFWEKALVESEGQRKSSTIKLTVKGLSLKEMLDWIHEIRGQRT
jgi:hypothetical protein